MKIFKTFIIVLSTLLVSHTQADNTYNFYFHDEGVPKVEKNNKEETPASKEEEKQEEIQPQTTDDLSEDKISKLAEEIAKKIGAGQQQNPQAFEKLPKLNAYDGENYLSIGLANETGGIPDFYGFEPSFSRKTMNGIRGNKLALRTKFLPYLGFEALIATDQILNTKNSNSKFHEHSRGGIFIEKRIFQKSGAFLNGGIIQRQFKNTNIYNTETYVSKTEDAYFGGGLRLRLMNFDLVGSLNFITEDMSGKLMDSAFVTAGLTYAIF